MRKEISLLLVDGHSTVREALADALRHAPSIGTVRVAGTLPEAVSLVRSHAPQVIIVDPRTLQGDAAEAVRLLVREGRCVVVLTSSLLEHEAAQYAQGGVSAFAFKGIPLAALISLIESLIGS